MAHRKPADWRLFPVTKAEAYFDSLGQFIRLNDWDATRLGMLLAGPAFPPATDAFAAYPVLFHELRHWVDFVATVWGRRRLMAGINAMNAFARGREPDFWRIAQYRKLVARDKYAGVASRSRSALA